MRHQKQEKAGWSLGANHHKLLCMLKITFFAGILGLVALSVGHANDRLVGEYGDWRLFANDSGQAKSCFIVGEPKRSTPQNARRGDIFLIVSHRPGQGVRNELSVRIGYPFSATSEPFARVGSDEYGFFTGVQVENGADEWAWLEELDNQARLVTAMKRGNELVFKGTSARGTLTTDSYSLKGVTAAMKALDAACPAP
ncbi:MAG: invasion associated locus B family protein [Alphaproteobacteria bacterium]|nr:invasion associated locus B family protein [Alphaproteobacteria bacterium]